MVFFNAIYNSYQPVTLMSVIFSLHSLLLRGPVSSAIQKLLSMLSCFARQRRSPAFSDFLPQSCFSRVARLPLRHLLIASCSLLSRCAGFGFAELRFASVPHCVRQLAAHASLQVKYYFKCNYYTFKNIFKKTEILHLFFIFD